MKYSCVVCGNTTVNNSLSCERIINNVKCDGKLMEVKPIVLGDQIVRHNAELHQANAVKKVVEVKLYTPMTRGKVNELGLNMLTNAGFKVTTNKSKGGK